MPRDLLVARSLSQLSMIIEVPAVAKPVMARKATHQISSTRMPVTSALIARTEMKPLKARTCPTRRTTCGASRQPSTKPAAQDVPSRPRTVVE